MLKPGGMLMYSTCTFSSKENEDNIRWFLKRFPAFHLKEISPYEGFSKGIYPDVNKCVRIWPHRMEGEGHFLALLKKEESALASKSSGDPAIPATGAGFRISETAFQDFMDVCTFPVSKDRLMLLKDLLYLLPEDFENPKGLRILRSGLLLGTLKNKRFTPSQAFAMAMKKSCFLNLADFDKNDLRVVKYLKGETIALDEETKGWTLVCVDGFPLGWGKASAGMLKNKYAAGWRMQ